MSFSSYVKNEISKNIIEDKSEVIAELCGLISMCATLKFKKEGFLIKFDTENTNVAKRIIIFLKSYYSKDVNLYISKNKKLKGKNLYSVILNDFVAVKKLINDTDLLSDKNIFSINYSPKILKTKSDIRAYIRGAFLGGGSITNPEKSYHIEFVSNNERHTEFLQKLINKFELNSKVILRKGNYIVYLKSAEHISDLLALIGASRSVLEFENIRVMKNMKNRINRIVNCETANLNKTINASVEQIKDIKYIDEILGIEKLPEDLKDIAKLRIAHNEYTLKDIGEMFNPNLSKSKVNYKLKKIKQIADKLRSEQNEKRN